MGRRVRLSCERKSSGLALYIALTADRLRASHRNHNRLVLDLDDPLSILDGDWNPGVSAAPATGRLIKGLDRQYAWSCTRMRVR